MATSERVKNTCPSQDHAALWEEARERNRLQAQPLPECPACGFPTLDGDWGAFNPDRCCMCDARWLDAVIDRITRRIGRPATVKTLNELAADR